MIADRVQTDALLGSPLKPTSQKRPDSVQGQGSCCCEREDDQEQAHREMSENITGVVFDEPLMSMAKLPLMSPLLSSVTFAPFTVEVALSAVPAVGALPFGAGDFFRFQAGCV